MRLARGKNGRDFGFFRELRPTDLTAGKTIGHRKVVAGTTVAPGFRVQPKWLKPNGFSINCGMTELMPWQTSRRRYRGRKLGLYALNGRGLIRNLGGNGGGTPCNGAPQLLQISCCVPSTRSQCPRAGHPGLKHCTVEPGRYCIALPDLFPAQAALRNPIAPVATREFRKG